MLLWDDPGVAARQSVFSVRAGARIEVCGVPKATPAIHGVVRWRLIDLAQWLYKEFTVSIENGSAKVCHGSGGIVLLRAE